MGHSRERSQKNCLNCNTVVVGRYCHLCGQENIEPRESFWSLVTHFFNDFTHFDGKFFSTLGNLVKRPGFLPAEYIKGRRARYLHPIRMYLFTSAVFFLIFFSFSSVSNVKVGFDINNSDLNTSDGMRPAVPPTYSSIAQYDSAQSMLAPSDRDGWLERMIITRVITINEKYNGRMDDLLSDLTNRFIHTFPTMLFVTLPLFALFLKWLYRKRDFYYADHAIFLIFLYILLFILNILLMGVSGIASWLEAGWLTYVMIFLGICGSIYLLLAMKYFYRQGIFKTLLKFAIFNILASITILILFVVFFGFVFFRA